MTMTPRARLAAALRRQPVDILPTQVNYTDAMGDRIALALGVTTAELPARLGNHLRRVDLSYAKRLSADGKVAYDWWGAGWHTETEGYWLAEAPLAETKDMDALTWPDPAAPHLLDAAAAARAADNGQHFIVPNFGFALYERAWSLRGFEALNIDLAEDPDFVGDLLDRIADIQVTLVRRYVELGVDGGYFGDDYGAQRSLLFSPRAWRRLFKPRLARMFAPFVEAGLPVLMHSDGDIRQILPDLVEIGLTALNPCQPEVLDHDWLAANFGGRLAFYGGISTQTVLPFGTPEEVRDAVAACMRTLAAGGTGLLLAPSHRMTSEIPLANVVALLEAFASQR